MLFLVLLYYLALSTRANPIPPITSRSLEPNSCSDLSHCRSIWNIIWSCIVMIFSCTWVAVHPNVPCPKKREGKNCFQRWIRNPLMSFVEHHLPLFILAHLPVPLSRKDNGWPHMLSKNFHKHPLKSLVIFFSSRLHEPVLK